MEEAEQTSGQSSPVPLTEDQRKHLDFIQAVIARLASSSATIKGWTLTLATFVFGYAATQGLPVIAGLGLVAVTVFGFLDSYYLRQERLFRCLYGNARRGKIEVYSMDKNAYSASCRRAGVFFSWTVLGFYGPLLLLGAGMLVWSIHAGVVHQGA